jgi:hypothetical protein
MEYSLAGVSLVEDHEASLGVVNADASGTILGNLLRVVEGRLSSLVYRRTGDFEAAPSTA